MKRTGMLPALFLGLMLCGAGAAEENALPAEGMEQIWEIEDTHTEWERIPDGLVTCGGVTGFDRDSATYYCTVEPQDEWPEITVSVGDGYHALILDDWTYDACRDALRQGMRYELMLYNDEGYAYAGLVFTGLPVITLRTDAEEIGRQDERAEIAVTGEEPLVSDALIHIRRSGYVSTGFTGKESYHVELHDTDGEKRKESVLGMDKDSDWLLLACERDTACVRNYVSWQLWSDVTPEDGMVRLESRMAEVFLNDRYDGVYQVSQRVRVKKELKKFGDAGKQGVVGRMVKTVNDNSKPKRILDGSQENAAELRYCPGGMTEDEAFGVLNGFYGLMYRSDGMSTEEFAEAVTEHFDVESLLRYFLFIQATNSWDSMRKGNNTYIWAVPEECGWRYSITLWDLDRTFEATQSEEEMEQLRAQNGTQFMEGMPVIVRILDLNVGDSRRMLAELWEQMKASAFNEEHLYERFDAAEELMNGSGAYVRNNVRWREDNGGELSLDAYRIYAAQHTEDIDRMLLERWPCE